MKLDKLTRQPVNLSTHQLINSSTRQPVNLSTKHCNYI